MAARKSSALHPRHRAAIQTTMLIKRLQGFILSEVDPATGRPVDPGKEMSRAQVSAAVALLRKTMPDLAVTQVEAGAGTAGAFVIFGQREAESSAEWQAQVSAPLG